MSMMRRSGAGLVITRSGKSRKGSTVSLCASAGSTHSGMPTIPRPASARPVRTTSRRVMCCVMRPKISRDPHPFPKLLIDRLHELVGRQMRMVVANQNRQILGHPAGLDDVHTHVLESVGKGHDVGRVVELAAILKPAGPRIDRGNRIGRRGFPLLLELVVACHGSVRRFRFDSLAVR